MFYSFLNTLSSALHFTSSMHLFVLLQTIHQISHLPEVHGLLYRHIVLQDHLAVVITFLLKAQLLNCILQLFLLLQTHLLPNVLDTGLVDLIVVTTLVIPTGTLELFEVLLKLNKPVYTQCNILR